MKLARQRGFKCQDTGLDHTKEGKKFADLKESEIGNYLILHEIDNNKKNLDASNLLILCKAANLKRRRAEGRFRFKRLKIKHVALDHIYTHTAVSEYPDSKIELQYAPFVKHLAMRPIFDNYLHDRIFNNPEGLPFDILIIELANETKGSRKWVKERLEEATCASGNYMTFRFPVTNDDGGVVMKSFIKFKDKQAATINDVEKKFNS